MLLTLRLLSWTLFAVLLALFVSMPISLHAQLTLAMIVFAVLVVLYMIGPRHITRQLFIAFSSALIMKYLYWRVTSTLPPVDDAVDFAAAVMLFAAELYSIVALYLTLFVVIDPLERPSVAIDETKPLPTVDVFVPTYDESPDLVAHTLAAAKAMDYDEGRFTVWLLDDGGTDEKIHHPDAAIREAARERKADMLEVANRLGVEYLARPRNEIAKAGNLNHGLAHSSAELVVVLDADHAPRRDFLKKTVGHFQEDETLFLVQTPHAFLNDDPIERNLGLAQQMPAEHQMFYKALQKGLDSWNASYFCGSAAVLKREALDEVGGFAGLSVTEDCETALELHARGWTSRFVDEPLIWGLQPETFTSLVKQRSRWCSGMIQIFVLKNPLVMRGLTVAQRLAYSASCLYWFFPLMRLTFVIAPLLYIFFGMEIFMASVGEFVAYTAPYIAAVVLLQSFLFGRQRWAWMSEVYEYVQSVHLWKSVIATVVAPRRPKFNVTPKGFILDEEKLSTMAPPYFVIFGVLVIALAVALFRIVTGDGNALLFIVTGWTLFNLVIAGIALGAVCDRRERRLAPRLGIERPVVLSAGQTRLACVVADVSQRGFACRLPSAGAVFGEGTRAMLTVPLGSGEEATTEVTVRRRGARNGELVVGVSFEGADERRFAAVAELLCNSEPVGSDRMSEGSRTRIRNLLVWTVEFLGIAGRETARGLAFGVWGRREAAAPPVRAGAELAGRLRGAVAARPLASGACIALAVAASLAAPAAFANEPRPAPVAAAAPAGAAAMGDNVLRRLPVTGETLFLQGEWSRRVVPIHLTPDEIASVEGLAVTAGAGVTALAEASSVDAWVNGVLLGRIGARHDRATTTVLDIPRTLLVPGVNEIAFTARHQHRASCDLDAGYELWTAIDVAASGLVLPARVAERADGLPQLLGLSPDPTRLSVLVPEGAGEGAATRAVGLASLVVLAAGLTEPRVDVVRSAREADGVLLTVAPDAPPAAATGWRPVTELPGVLARKDGGLTREIRLVAASAAEAGETIARLAALVAGRTPAGSPRGLAALARSRPAPLEPGSSVTFADLGAEDRYFAGRRFEETVFVDLPSDVVASGREVVTLKLRGDYARDLAPEARLVIKVNGAKVREMPLASTPQTTLNHKPFALPLAPFQAGRNRLTIEAELPAAADAACPAGETAVNRARFFLSAASSVELPRLGRAGVAPDLAALWWDGFPYGREPGPADVFVGEDGAGLSAASALLAAIAANSGRLEPWQVRYETPRERAHGLLVAPRDATPPVARAMIEGRTTARGIGAIFAGALAAEAALPVPFSARYGDGGGASVAAGARLHLAQESWAGEGRRPALSPLLDSAVPPTMTVAVLSAADVHAAVSRGPDEIPFAPRGSRFAFAGDVDASEASASRPVMFATEAPSLGNLRLVLGKWMSANPEAYAVVLLLVAGLLGLTLHFSARGRKSRVRPA